MELPDIDETDVESIERSFTDDESLGELSATPALIERRFIFVAQTILTSCVAGEERTEILTALRDLKNRAVDLLMK